MIPQDERHLHLLRGDPEVAIWAQAQRLVHLLDERHGHPGGEIVRDIAINAVMLVALHGLIGAVDLLEGRPVHQSEGARS